MNHENHEGDLKTQWRASVAMLSCEQLKLFAKLTLNAYLITVWTLIKNFWWVFAVWLGLIYWPAFMEGFHKVLAKIAPDAAMRACYISINMFFPLVLFFIVCAARSSITQKNFIYFLKKTARFFIPFIFVTILLAIPTAYGMKLLHIPEWLHAVISLHLALFAILFCFFYIDTRSIIKALWNAARMMLYTYPIVLLVALFGFALNILLGFVLGFLSVFISNIALVFWTGALIFWLIGSPLIVVMISNIYMKHAYEYNKIYCPVP